MSESNGRRTIHWDNSIRLDTTIQCIVILLSVGGLFATLKSGIDQNSRDIDKIVKVLDQKVDKEMSSKSELELSRRIVDAQREQNNAMSRIDDGFKELKGMIRDLDLKLDRKADKPAR
jgi:hypothetical protein